MFRSFSIRQRLTTMAAMPLLLLVLVLTISFNSMSTLNSGIESLYQDRVVPLKQIKATSDQYGIAIVDLFHKFRGQQLSASQLNDAIHNARARAEDEWNAYKATLLTAEEKRLIAAADQEFGKAAAVAERFLQQVSAGTFLSMNNQQFIAELYGAFDPLTIALDKLISLQLEVSEAFVAESQENFAALKMNLLLLAALLFVLVSVIGIGIYRSIQDPVAELGRDLDEITAHLDLTRRVKEDGRDELTRLSASFNHMLTSFHSLVTNLRDAAHQSSTAAEEMSSISRQVSSTVSHQEDQVGMVATAITQMSGAVQEVAGNANSTSEQATAADQQARQGREKVQQNLNAINTLSTSVSHASDVINQLHSQSGEISEVLTVIRSIAEQTNLLALNAAIESARAGEAGRGFAVVADEVRKLAQSTQEATESIGTMIQQLQSSASEAVSTMNQASTDASSSLGYAREAGELLESIASAVSRIAEMNFQVSTATEEQAQVADEIHKNVSMFSMGLKEVSESANQSALASEEIARLSNDLHQQVNRFRA